MSGRRPLVTADSDDESALRAMARDARVIATTVGPYRKYGVKLVDAAVAHARRVGALRVELATQHGNDSALRVYHAKGFVVDTAFAHLSAQIDTGGSRRVAGDAM